MTFATSSLNACYF